MSNNLALLTIAESAERFPGLTAHRIRKLVKTGQLPFLRAGSKYLIAEQAIIDLITQNCLLSPTESDTISHRTTITTGGDKYPEYRVHQNLIR